jgi:hypothetical protein
MARRLQADQRPPDTRDPCVDNMGERHGEQHVERGGAGDARRHLRGRRPADRPRGCGLLSISPGGGHLEPVAHRQIARGSTKTVALLADVPCTIPGTLSWASVRTGNT